MTPLRRLLGWLSVCLGLVVASPSARGGATGTIAGEISVNPSKYRAGVVVYLDKVKGTFTPPPEPVTMNQKKLAFVPRVLPVVRGTQVRFVNEDNVAHNVYSPDGETYDLGSWPKGEARVHTFSKPGVYTQLCRIHPEMVAYVVVLDNPYFAVTGKDGRFAIDHVPAGRYTLKVWSERYPEATQSATVAAGGRAELRIELKR